jgi:hypothetical protein
MGRVIPTNKIAIASPMGRCALSSLPPASSTVWQVLVGGGSSMSAHPPPTCRAPGLAGWRAKKRHQAPARPRAPLRGARRCVSATSTPSAVFPVHLPALPHSFPPSLPPLPRWSGSMAQGPPNREPLRFSLGVGVASQRASPFGRLPARLSVRAALVHASQLVQKRQRQSGPAPTRHCACIPGDKLHTNFVRTPDPNEFGIGAGAIPLFKECARFDGRGTT